ncbi:hypothetical protein ACO0LL_24400 [Undibacterium sp. TC4M20W]|jgi:hypothetical protein
MKKYLILFLGVTIFAAVSASTTDYKACYKRCMEKIDDKEKCEKICKDD